VRTPGNEASLRLEGVHSGGVHTVAWAPGFPSSSSSEGSAANRTTTASGDLTSTDHCSGTSGDTSSSTSDNDRESFVIAGEPTLGTETKPHLLLTAGNDPVIHVFDVRRANAHTPLYSYRGHCHPAAKKFPTILPPKFLSPDVIVAPGEGSLALSLYCTRTGDTISRGEMTDQPMAIACNYQRKLLDSHGGLLDTYDIAVSCKRGGLIYCLKPIT
jgi:hypothetical protein